MRYPGRLVLPALAAVAALVGCGGSSEPTEHGQVEVVAAFYPLEYVAGRIGGDDVHVSGLTKPGSEPHDLELTPQQVATLGEADLVLVLGGFQPAVDEAAGQQAEAATLDVAGVDELEPGFTPIEDGELHEDERGVDPHVWLDPARLSRIARSVEDRLAEIDRANASAYRERGVVLRADLDALDKDFRSGLARCERKEIVTSHNSFGYLARAYGLEQIGITGLTPEEEPAPRRLAEVTDLARKRRVTTIFFEDLVSPKVAESLAREVGAVAKVLSPLESPPESGDYLTAMRANLTALRAALGCP
ncbi:MAG TPA: metal ABC transporter substrate-binding protein [Mycobacteriales bacterium]|nr:metal ABC transporter substrate-binding protein [Mycobacteriales bacterium]